MSLLLLFPTGTPSWSNTTLATSVWVNSHYDFKNIWSEWGTYTWGALATSGYTWGYLEGLTFTNTTGNSTTWTRI